jgi:hypothetical protein
MNQVIFSLGSSMPSRSIEWRKSLLRSVSCLALFVSLLPLVSYAQVNSVGILGRVMDAGLRQDALSRSRQYRRPGHQRHRPAPGGVSSGCAFTMRR